MIIHIRQVVLRQVVPAVGIAERVGGLPLAEFRTVAAEEEGVAEFADSRFAGEEIILVVSLIVNDSSERGTIYGTEFTLAF